MQTRFSSEQMQNPAIKIANDILRKCVHCGFCTATCPTYVLLGDEADSPRGRIYMIRDMLEKGDAVPPLVVTHVDRCLSCLSCMTTCPSGVDYMHLIDHTRAHIEKAYVRPMGERLLRSLLAMVVPNPSLFRLSLMASKLVKPFRALMPGRLKGMVGMAPAKLAAKSPMDTPQVFPAAGERRMRVALMTGCAQQVLRPSINEATIRLLTRHGCEVVVAAGGGCCGALVHHMGREADAQDAARTNVAAWMAERDDKGLDGIIINASGCGTTVKDYGFLLQDDADWAEAAKTISALTRDVTEIMDELGGPCSSLDAAPVVAYRSACSMQHGQKLTTTAKKLLADAGFEVREPAEGHLCCGSAGTYNLLQPELAERLGARKAANLEAQSPDLIASGNIGCLVQISGATSIPVVHTAELLDWASGGPKPRGVDT